VGEHVGHDIGVEISSVRPRDAGVTSPQGLDRLDPQLVAQSTLFRVPLTAESLPSIRQSLDERRAQQVAATDPGGVSIASSTVELPGRSVGIRVYRGSPDRAAPVTLFFHSGGLVLGNLDTDHLRCLALARGAECVLISVDYRLAPEHPFPAAFDDCLGVTEAVLADPGTFGVDAARLALSGSSAGAGLAAAVALCLRDRGGPQPVLQLLHQPMLDDTTATPSMREFLATPGFDSESARFSWDSYLQGRPAEAYASPARAASFTGLPPAHVCCSEVDPLRDEAIDLARRLLEAGVPTELHVVPGTCHGFDSFAPGHPFSVRETAAQADALRRAFARVQRG
jgi:acetyl esterase/lipase